ncbi:MAG: hypothetical protein JJLCMIEE_02904 [Acidimicrobiales bacterium]|nr:hypothetical protein [Acidimicrobiales bacterium]RIK04403.1 MAG: hypothetical protein DCC48_13575 [Acidobacteriota bacterium]
MDAPTCPSCGDALTRVLDLPYGYWEWNGTEYELKSTSQRVDVAPWACAGCLGELRDFHPQDKVSRT